MKIFVESINKIQYTFAKEMGVPFEKADRGAAGFS